jgi:tetratricopeptide (TPR) repeat protein
MKKYDKALPLYEKSLKIVENISGENHPSTATNYNNLGSLYQDMKKYDKALPLYEKSLEIRENILGINHPDVAGSFNNLGFYYVELKYCKKAKEYFEKAKIIYENSDYNKSDLDKVNNAIKQILKNQKLEAKATRKGRFCKDEKII